MFLEKELQLLENKKNKIEKKEIDLIICDFDDTIFSRKEQLEKSDLLRNNRWNQWNIVIIEQIWLSNFIKEFYENKKYPKNISSKLRENHDLILTAWFQEIQTEKLKATNLDKFNFKIVLNAEEKIIETIKYVVNNLWFIPNKITVYEDRPNYFIEHRELIEKFFWTELEILFVELTDNNTEPKITKN